MDALDLSSVFQQIDEMTSALIDLGYNQTDVIHSIKDAKSRLAWTIGSFCFVYSRKHQNWFKAQIADIIIDEATNERWLTVKYSNNNTKKIQHFNQSIKPMEIESDSNANLLQIILNKLKNTQKQQQQHFDLSVFKDHKHKDECNRSGANYTECTAMKRLITALKYYYTLNIMHNKYDEELFAHFMNTLYPGFIDDYIHFQDDHQHDLEQINKDLTENQAHTACNITQCEFTSRHHRKDQNDAYDVLDTHLNFYKEMMDGLHFHVFHCFDVGLRSKERVDDDETKEQMDGYFDAMFARMNKDIAERLHLTSSFERFSTNNSKYNIVTDNKTGDDNTTFPDALFIYLLEVNVDAIDVKTLAEFINNHEFDTDSIQYDHGIKLNGNIMRYINNKKVLEPYDRFVIRTKMSGSAFSVGVRYYYWSFYKHMRDDIDGDSERRAIWNINDHSGYRVKDLYVEAKYDSFKEEISNYKYITFKQYEDNVVIKVKKYENAKWVKKTTTHTADTAKELHYDIKPGESIHFEHLLSLTLYTDWTDLCSDFSSTFRKKNGFETLRSMINRNKEYYWMSRRLRECVEMFGQSKLDDKRYRYFGNLKGPFYCGMNIVMNIPSINMRLCGPTSTSKQIEVAMKFSGDEGMVLQLDNNNLPYFYLNGFNASWISRYKEEDERLFFGGTHWIKIESVRLKSTNQNFKEFIHALYCLDEVLSGGQSIVNVEIKKQDIIIIDNLMKTALDETATKRFDEYIYSTFAAFTLHKTQIALDFNQLRFADRKMINLLFMDRMDVRSHIETDEKKRDDTDCCNLLKLELFKIFTNIQSVIIKTTQGWNNSRSYSMSMVGLLSLIEFGKVDQVVIKAPTPDHSVFNWINNLWISSSGTLIKEYDAKNYSIGLKKISGQNDAGYKWEEYHFLINKRKY